MIRDRDIIIVSSDDWGIGLKTSKYHLATKMAKFNNRILFVESTGLRSPKLSKFDLKRITGKFRGMVSRLRQVQPNIFILTPPAIPLHRFRPIGMFNSILLTLSIKSALLELRFRSPILFIFIPTGWALPGKLGESIAIYYCVDDYSSFTGVHSQTIRRLERKLLESVQICITSSLKLYEEKIKVNPNTFYIPHGIDVAHFARAFDPDLEVPDDLDRIPRPRIGFYGFIERRWLDFDLLEYLASRHPEWSLVLIGKLGDDISHLLRFPNVHYLGVKPYEELPAYNKGFDVAVIPFAMNEMTVNSNPLKLREYLASGLPVVATDLPEIRKFSDVVYLARDHREFEVALEVAIHGDIPYLARRRLEAVRDESWENRFELLSQIVERYLYTMSPSVSPSHICKAPPSRQY